MHTFDWTGKISVLLAEIQFQEYFVRVGCDGRNTVQSGQFGARGKQLGVGGRQVSAGFSLKLGL